MGTADPHKPPGAVVLARRARAIGMVVLALALGCGEDESASVADVTDVAYDVVDGDGVDMGPDQVDTVPDTTLPTADVVPPDALADSRDSQDLTELPDTTDACATICEARGNDPGFCAFEGFFGVAECRVYCGAQSAGWDGVAQSAFEVCATQDPLCYQTIHQCMMFGIYQAYLDQQLPIGQLITVNGSDFTGYEGKRVLALLQRDLGGSSVFAETFVRGGVFGFVWERSDTLPIDGTYRVALYLDVDDDLVCEPEGDLAFVGDATPRFGAEPLHFNLTISVDEPAHPLEAQSICGRFNQR